MELEREGEGVFTLKCVYVCVGLTCSGIRLALEGRNEGGTDKARLPQEHTLTVGSDTSDRDVTSLTLPTLDFNSFF